MNIKPLGAILLAVLLAALPHIASAQTIPTQTATVNATFTDNSNSLFDQEDGFYVYRCAGAGCIPTARIQTLGRNVTSFTDVIQGDVGGASYTYGVSAFNDAGESQRAMATFLTPAVLAVPGAPSGLIATVVGVTLKQ